MGNPAAVVKLKTWLPERELKIRSLNLDQPVTSFIVATEQGYDIRWFAGDVEINLCGHGSLAAAAAIFEMTPEHGTDIQLMSKYGSLIVNKCAEGHSMTMPSWKPVHRPKLQAYSPLLGLDPLDVFGTRDLIFVLENEQEVRDYKPDFNVIKSIADYHAVIVTAQKGNSGYVLRFFAPKIGINEDIATGSAQCSLGSYWSNKLSVNKLEVNQLSSPGGYFHVSYNQSDSIELKANVLLTKIVNLDNI